MTKDRAREIVEYYKADQLKRVRALIGTRAMNGKTFAVCRANAETCKELASDGYHILRLPPFALIKW